MTQELEQKVKQSLALIKVICNSKDSEYVSKLAVGFSGGKDSVVVYDLVMQVNPNIPCYYANTTIDPPGTLAYVRSFKNVQIVQPKESFYQLVQRKGLPTRLSRYCCQMLKEKVGADKNLFEGIRSCESRNREGRDYVQCDDRSWYNGQHIYPIYDWTDEDVWEYIKERNLPINPNYKQAGGCMERIGCVGCPMGGRYQRRREFDAFPKHLNAIRIAIKKGMERHPKWKLTRLTGGDPDKALEWWLWGRDSMEKFFNK